MQIVVIRDTFFKQAVLQASSLSAGQKCFEARGASYPIAAYVVTADHIKFTLDKVNNVQQAIAGRNTWYAYSLHVQIVDNKGTVIDLTPGDINNAGLKMIQDFEGCELCAYQDAVGVWTIGYGHTGNDVYAGQQITYEQADNLLRLDLHYFETQVNKLVTVPLTPNQFAALVSFTYNLGEGALGGSTLLRLLNEQDYNAAADQFPLWNKAGGQVLEGLTRRREAERALFLS